MSAGHAGRCDVDATDLLRLRATLNADESAPKISLLALLAPFLD